MKNVARRPAVRRNNKLCFLLQFYSRYSYTLFSTAQMQWNLVEDANRIC